MSRAATRKIAMFAFAKCSAASVAVAHGQAYPQENLLTDSARHPNTATNLFSIIMLVIKFGKTGVLISHGILQLAGPLLRV
jgi:hypothetical protein